jgi:hypothetical protein
VGRGVGANEQQGGRFERGPRLYTVGMGSVYGAPHRKPLAIAGGALGRHCALSAGVYSVSSVATWLVRNTGGFSQDTIGFRLDPVATVHHDARWGWQRVDVTMSCRRA